MTKSFSICETPGMDRGCKIGERAALQRPRFVAATVLALITSVMFCWPVWPGYMSYDSLFAYREASEGIDTAMYPPMHAYLFFLARQVGAGPAGLFFVQTFVIFFSAAIIISLVIHRSISVLVAFVAFSLIFVYFPTMIGTLFVLWKDVTTASFAVLGVALWLLAVRGRSFITMMAAIAALSVCIALRYNALPLVVFILALMIYAPFGAQRRRHDRLLVGVAVLTGLLLAFASMTWRLPDFKELPPGDGFADVLEFDLLGVSACSGHNYLPLAISSGEPIAPDQIRHLYDPRTVGLAFRVAPGMPHLVNADLYYVDAGRELPAVWKQVIPREIGCYLTHRAAVFLQQMGMAPEGVFAPTYGGIDANPYGIKLAHPEASVLARSYVVQTANEPWRRPALLYVMAAIVTVAGLFWTVPGRAVITAAFFGACAYAAALFFVGPAADARYIFPSNVFCDLLTVLGVALLLRRWVQSPEVGLARPVADHRLGPDRPCSG
jgi:hypothetical protein